MKKILLYINVLIATMLFASCAEFLDVNVDPNNPTQVTPNLVLPQAQKYTAEYMYNNRYLNNLGNMMMYNWSQSDGFSWYPDEFKYLVTSSFYQQLFENAYTSPLKQYNVLDQQEDSKFVLYKAIGKIMKAYHFQILVDLYGDVPYSEALGRSLEATPKYDDAQTIYNDLIVQLTAAIQLIKDAEPTAVSPTVNDDVIFGGNMDNWIRFANSLKVRILVRQSDIAGIDSYIQTEMAAIAAEGTGYITENVGVKPGYLKEADKQNPLWNTFGSGVDGTKTMNNNATCATDYILTYLQNTSDPRIDFLYEEPATGHLGVPQGLLDYDTPVLDAYVPENVSNIGPGILKSYNMPAIIFTLAENNFNLAELAVKNFITDDAQTLYQLGIQASFTTLGAGDATGYYTQTTENVGWNFSPDKIEAIITQKWLALNGINAEQSWFDYTRTGFPSGLPISLLASTPDRPVRLFYTSREISANGENVPSQPDAFTAKIFWAN
jgi:hypothetical protein